MGSLDSHVVLVIASSIQDVKDVTPKRGASTQIIRGIRTVNPINLKRLQCIRSAYFLEHSVPLHHFGTAATWSCHIHFTVFPLSWSVLAYSIHAWYILPLVNSSLSIGRLTDKKPFLFEMSVLEMGLVIGSQDPVRCAQEVLIARTDDLDDLDRFHKTVRWKPNRKRECRLVTHVRRLENNTVSTESRPIISTASGYDIHGLFFRMMVFVGKNQQLPPCNSTLSSIK